MGYTRAALVVLMLSIVLAHSAAVYAQPAGPIEVVKSYISTANTGDFEQTFAFYADNAVVRNPLGLFVGKERIGVWLRQDIQTTRATPKDFQVLNGNTIINTGVVSLARFKSIGIDQVEYRSEYIVENGKIRFFAPTVILTPEQQEKVRATTPAAPAPAVDPVEVVKNYINAANASDFEGALAFYADSAVVKNPLGLFVGKDAIGAWLREDVKTTRAMSQEFQVINGGTTVINTGTVSLARFKTLGIDQVAYRSEYLIEDGKIKYFAPTPLLTPEQQAKVRAAQASTANAPAGAPASLPRTAAPATSIWFALAVAGAFGVLGLVLLRRRNLQH